MERFFSLLSSLLALFLVSCTRDFSSASVNNIDLKEEFAKIVSKALHEEAALRFFIKEEALSMFDKDYDVLYMKVKDELIDGDRSFRDIMIAYDSNGLMNRIESEIPLLTILVPDWSWVNEDCFCAENWDTSSEVVYVSPGIKNEFLTLYLNGHVESSLAPCSFPSFPVLIVKENERVRMVETKSPTRCFEFINEEFDGSVTKTVSTSTINFNPLVAGDKISGYTLVNRLATVYDDTRNTGTSITQRDYIYYGMDATTSSGILDRHYLERLYAISLINPLTRFYSDEDGVDFHPIEDGHINVSTTKIQDLPGNWLTQRAWIDGNVDLYFYIYAGELNMTKYKNLTFRDCFSVSSVKMDVYVNSHGQREGAVYRVDDTSFTPRWAMVDIPLFTWDINTIPTKYLVRIQEFDASGYAETQITETFTTNSSRSDSSNYESDTYKSGYTSSSGDSSTQTYNYTYRYTLDSDELGSFYVWYDEPVMLSPTVLTSTPNTRVFTYATGAVTMVMLPEYISF